LPASDRRHLGCGCSSVVEHDLAKVGVEGSSPFARSRFFLFGKAIVGPRLLRGGLRRFAAMSLDPRSKLSFGSNVQRSRIGGRKAIS
jgi:hypothetical protein